MPARPRPSGSGQPDDWPLTANYVPRKPWAHAKAPSGDGTGAPTPRQPRKENMTDISTALESARQELFGLGVMTPGDLLEETSPAAALLFGFETARAVIAVLGGAVDAAGRAPDGADEILSAALNGAAAALAGYTHALVELRVLPTEAEDAITAGLPPLSYQAYPAEDVR